MEIYKITIPADFSHLKIKHPTIKNFISYSRSIKESGQPELIQLTAKEKRRELRASFKYKANNLPIRTFYLILIVGNYKSNK